jgi:hypothetical protein
VNLVDEENIAFTKLGEDGSKVSGTFERWTAGDMQSNTHLDSDDACHCCFAETWRTCEQDVIGCLPSLLCSTQNNVEMFFEFSLTDKLVERTWT